MSRCPSRTGAQGPRPWGLMGRREGPGATERAQGRRGGRGPEAAAMGAEGPQGGPGAAGSPTKAQFMCIFFEARFVCIFQRLKARFVCIFQGIKEQKKTHKNVEKQIPKGMVQVRFRNGRSRLQKGRLLKARFV